MVDFLGRSKNTVFLTLFTQWVSLDVTVTDTLPRSTVAFVGLGVTLIFVVGFVCFFFMLGAVLLSIIAEPTAARIRTWSFRFVGHLFHLTFDIAKASTVFSCKGLLIIFFYYYCNIKVYSHSSHIYSHFYKNYKKLLKPLCVA